MRLKLEIPDSWPRLPAPPAKTKGEVREVFEPSPGVTLTLEPLWPLPDDLRAWGDQLVLGGVDPSTYRVRNVDDLHTLRGWPVTVFFSDIMSILPESPPVWEGPQLFGGEPPAPAAPRVLERRLHALYLFDEHCGAAIVRSKALPRFDALMSELRRVLLTAEPDWSADRVLALAHVWGGLEVTRDEPPPREGSQIGGEPGGEPPP